LGKLDSKVFEGIFVAYSSTSKAYRIFNRYTLTIEESMHVKFKESIKFVKNIVDVQINSLCKDMDKATLKDAPIQEKSGDEEPSKNDQEECLEEVQPSQLFQEIVSIPQVIQRISSGEVSKVVATRSIVHIYVIILLLFHT